ncbi:zinc-ribbon domain-containing protein [Colwellia sp. 12G3]|uniref:zinc-ribbon domain-containing protein n=1 Tax=Colwellia sp. 12G3 TaxID=2058299 RepID=UPI0012FEBE11
MFDVTHGSRKKYWWKPYKNHEWQAIPFSRSVGEIGCPQCYKRKRKRKCKCKRKCKRDGDVT